MVFYHSNKKVTDILPKREKWKGMADMASHWLDHWEQGKKRKLPRNIFKLQNSSKRTEECSGQGRPFLKLSYRYREEGLGSIPAAQLHSLCGNSCSPLVNAIYIQHKIIMRSPNQLHIGTVCFLNEILPFGSSFGILRIFYFEVFLSFNYVYPNVGICIWVMISTKAVFVYESWCPQKPEKSSRSFGTITTDGCEQFNIGLITKLWSSAVKHWAS